MPEAAESSGVFERVLAERVRELRADPRVQAAMVSGSYVSGRIGPYSDLDLYLLVAEGSGLPAWRTVIVNAVEVEETAHTADGYRRIIDEGTSVREIIFPLSVGRLLFDREDQFSRISEAAKDRVRDLSEVQPPDAKGRQSIQRALAYGFRKIGNALASGDTDRFRYELGFVLHLVPGLLLQLTGHRVSPDPLRDFRSLCPGLWPLYAACAQNGNVPSQWDGFERLMRQVFVEFSLGELPQPLWPLMGRPEATHLERQGSQ
jgi:predicted nucleotidyltransferase